MAERKRFTFLKLEGIFFAVAIVFFTVMYYFKYLDIYTLTPMLLFFCAMLFSINGTIQANRSSVKIGRFNIWLSILLSVAGTVAVAYFYSNGLLSF